MPLQRKTRKAADSEESHPKRARKNIRKTQPSITDMFTTNSCTRARTQSEPFSLKKSVQWFKEFADNGQIEPDGMERLCIAINVEPDDVVMLILAYKLNARKMGFFSLEEWTKGMQNLQCDCTSKLQNKLNYLRGLLTDSVQFKSIYRYAFDFTKESGQRTLELETAKIMLDVLLENRWVLYPQFQSYLKVSKFKAINRDQWNNILEFSKQIKDDLSNYDMDGAWPVLMDEFVEFTKKHREKP